jgi:hypothetical protein
MCLAALLCLLLAACSLRNSAVAPAPAPPPPDAPTARAQPGRYAVLFDAGHGQTFGNADWVISTSQPDPLGENPNPRAETDWTGGLSAWGVALHQTGRYQLLSLPRGERISYGDKDSRLDLANFDVFVVPEPNIRFTSAEKTAIMSFVQQGGGLFMIANHDGSDRNSDGMDSLRIWNDLMSSNTVQAGDPFGFRFDEIDIGSDNPRDIAPGAGANPVIRGPFGTATGSIIRGGTTATIDRAANPSVQPLLYRSRADTGGTAGVFFLTSAFGKGRVAAWGDSSPIDDGTGARADQLFDGWDDAGGSNAILALNATEWLAQAGADAAASSAIQAATAPAVAGPPKQTLVRNGDFERGEDGWRASSSDGRPLVGAERAHGGAQSAMLCGTNGCKATLAQKLDLPANAKMITLLYYIYIETQETNHAFDFLDVEIRDAGGVRLRSIQKLSDGDPAGAWQEAGADLSEFAGQTVQLVFTATSGRTKPTTFYVDDVSVSVE